MTTPRLRPLLAVAAALLAVLATTSPARGDELADLVERADLALRGDTSAAVLEMHIVTRSYERSYSIVAWNDSRKDRSRALIKILGPALWRGFGTLKIGNQLKLYDPKTNHVAVVSSSMLGDSWMGSHFSNDDLVKETELARDYDVALDKKWKAESGLGEGSTMYRVTLTPKPTAPVAWARIVYEVARRGDLVIPVEARYYRKKGQKRPSRVMTFDQVDELGGRQLPTRLKMTVAGKPGEYTSIHYKRLEFDVKIPRSKFTEQALRK